MVTEFSRSIAVATVPVPNPPPRTLAEFAEDNADVRAGKQVLAKSGYADNYIVIINPKGGFSPIKGQDDRTFIGVGPDGAGTISGDMYANWEQLPKGTTVTTSWTQA